ncbi:hypothetical protein HPB50_011060 [Hyalomma asiaticum]|uniref:Uncharacterized protein n=1 Tax=Hyalomma asiaticum TaxID=266040 RepID=A0ACB7T4P2_HYAAI|nr:hypothetical protein HPB50_011060 [Hyalomma asiaticum]
MGMRRFPKRWNGDGPLLYLRPRRRRSERGNSQLGAELRKPNWDQIHPEPFEKNIYREHPITASRPEAQVDDYRRANGVSIVRGRGVVAKPILNFEEAVQSFPEYLVDSVRSERNGGSPTCLEAQCWPVLLSGRDFLGVVPAGSSKRYAYIFPAIAHALSLQRPRNTGRDPAVVVLAPTRELAQHIHGLMCDLEKFTALRSVCVHSGAPKLIQQGELARGCDFCVATPTRLLEFLVEHRVHLRPCTFLAVDEADRMFAMGLSPEVLRIVEQMRPDRQTVVWIASWPKYVRPFLEALLGDYVQVTFGTAQDRLAVKQTVYVVKDTEKELTLATLLEDLLKNEGDRAVVFARMQVVVTGLVLKLREDNWRTVTVLRGMSQVERGWALSTFRNGNHCVLLSTHGSARDLDLDGVRFLVHFDFPDEWSDYSLGVQQLATVADGDGRVFSFFTPKDSRHANELVATLRDAKQEVPPALLKLAKEASGGVMSGHRAKW